MKVINVKDLFPSSMPYDKVGDELEINGELYYTLEQVQFYDYGYIKEWVKEID